MKLKLMRKIAQTLALLVVVVGGAVAPVAGVVIPGLQSVAYAADSSGTFGTAKWEIKDNVLTIHAGTFGPNTNIISPWMAYGSISITKVIIEPGVIANSQSKALFANFMALQKIEGIKNLDVSAVTNAADMFNGCSNLENLDIANWDTHSFEDTSRMFNFCQKLIKIPVENWNTGKLKMAVDMFSTCQKITSMDLSGWNTVSLESVSAMFTSCTALKRVNVSTWDTTAFNNSAVTNMFYFCTSLETLDLSGWDTRNVTNMISLFGSNTKLWKLTLGPNCQLASNFALTPLPAVGTRFDMLYTTTSATEWREVGTSTNPHDPNGVILAGSAIPANHNDSGVTHTYVWQGTPGDTTVDYTVDPAYTIEIPSSITIDSTEKYGSGAVVLGANPKLPYEDSLITIGVASTDDWKLKVAHDDTGVTYRFGTSTTGNQLSSGEVLTFFADGTNPSADSRTVYASVPDGSQFKYAGTYTDTVNYTISTGAPQT